MADENDIRYGLEADASQGIQEVRRLQQEVDHLTRGMVELERVTQSAIRAARTVKGKATVVSNVAQGLTQEDPKNDRFGAAARDAALRNRMLKLESTQQNIEARWVDAVHKSFKRILNTTQEMIKARETQAIHQQREFLKRMNTPNYLEAQSRQADYNMTRLTTRFGSAGSASAYKKKLVEDLQQEMVEMMDEALQGARRRRRVYSNEREKRLAGETFDNQAWVTGQTANDRFNQARTIRRGQVGVQAESWENTLNRLGSDGGADIMAVQTRIMVGYAALSAAINMARSLSTFVVQLDKEFSQFQAITNTTSAEMVQVKKDLIGVSEATKFTALEVAEAATILGQAGLSAQNVRESIEAITLLATASGSTLNDAVEAVTSTLSIFNLQADQATQIANTFTAALNGSKLSMDKITLGLQYAGNTAAQFGVTYQELSATLGAMANSGIKSGSTLGTGMRMLLVSLTEPTKKFRQELATLGLTTDDVDVKAKGIMGVMRTLQEAGFGASEAYRSFEVRAASAFAALSNNLDLGLKLEENFIGSSAAFEANATQMEAMANQADRLKSATGTLAFNALEPFLELMSDGIRILADFVSLLNQMTGILPIVGGLLAGAGTGLAIKTFSALGRGAYKGLATGATAARLAGGATEGAAVAAGTNLATTAVRGLQAAVMANPYTALAAAAVAAATAVYAYNDRMSESERRMESLKGLASRYKQEADTINQEISAIDQTLDNLSNRRIELENNPDQLRLKVAEIAEQFGELGANVDLTTATVQDLIEALNQLKLVNLGEMATQLGNIVATNNLIVAQEEQKRLTQLASDLTRNRAGAGAAALDINRARNPGYGSGVDPSQVLSSMQDRGGASYWRQVNYDASRQLQNNMSGIAIPLPDLQNLIDLVAYPAGLSDARRAEPWMSRHTRLNSTVSEMERRRIELEGIRDSSSSGRFTSIQKQEYEELARGLEFLKTLLDASEPTIQSLTKQQQLKRENEAAGIQEAQTKRDTIVQSSGLAQRVREDTDLLNQWRGAFQNIIEDESTTTAERDQALADLENAVDILKDGREGLIDELRKELVAAGSSLEQANAAIGMALTSANTAGLGIEAFSVKTKEELDKLKKRQLESQEKTAEAAIKRARSRLTTASTTQSNDAAKELVLSELDRLDRMKKATYEQELSMAKDVNEQAILTEAFQREQADRDQGRQEVIAAWVANSRQIERTILEGQIRRLEDQEALIQAEIDKVTTKINEGGAGLNFDGLVASLGDFYAQMRDLAGLRLNLQANLAGVSDGPGDFFDALYKRESGNNFNERNSRGFTGRGQFGDKRLTDYNRATGNNYTLDQIRGNAGVQRNLENWHWSDIGRKIEADPILQAAIGTSINGVTIDRGAMYGMAHLGGFGGMRNFVTSGGAYNPNDRHMGGNADLLEYARLFSGRDVNLAAFNSRDLGLSQGGYDDAVARREAEVAARRTAQAKDAEATRGIADEEVRRLVAQATAENDQGALQKIIRTITQVTETRMAAELEKWDAEHAGDKADPAGRAALVSSLQQSRNSDIQAAMEEWTRAATVSLTQPLADAQAKLAEAQKYPERFSAEEMRGFEKAVTDAERLQTARELASLDAQRAEVVKQQALAQKEYGAEALATLDWGTRLAEIDRQRLELQKQLNIEKAAEKGGSQSPEGAYESAFETWRKSQSTFVNPDGTMVSEAKQMENLWGEVLTGLQDGFSNFFMSLGEGFTSIGASVKALGLDIIKMLQQMTARALAFQTMMMLGKSIPFIGDIVKFAGMPMMNGGMVPRRAQTGALLRGGIPGRDSIPVLAEDGEIIMRRSAVNAIGADKLLALNALGNRTLDPGVPSASAFGNKETGGGTVNVWVVTPDQQPSSVGPEDIIAVVGDNIETRGSLRKLIKSVQMNG